MRLLGASGVSISFFSWGIYGVSFVGYEFFLKLTNHNTIVWTRGSWGNQLLTLVIYPSVYPSIHPSASPSIHPPIQVPTWCRALCWALRHRLKKLGLVPNSRVLMPCQVRWTDRTRAIVEAIAPRCCTWDVSIPLWASVARELFLDSRCF